MVLTIGGQGAAAAGVSVVVVTREVVGGATGCTFLMRMFRDRVLVVVVRVAQGRDIVGQRVVTASAAW